jgi:hypothetical protein
MKNVAPSAQRRWPFVVLCVLLLGLALLGCVYFYHTTAADRVLNAAVAETDEVDPRWRLEDIEADRAVVPDERNSGLTAIAATRLLPEKWPAWSVPDRLADRAAEEKRGACERSFGELEPQEQLNTEQIDALRSELKRAAAALAEARKIADLPDGRYAVTFTPDFISTLLPHTQEARGIANLLSYDALLRAQDQDADGALESCRAVLNAGRSVGDEPCLISQLVRIACRAIALEKAERTLAQGEPSDAALAQLQQLLEQEESAPLLLIGMRGERAGEDRLMDAIQTGKIKLTGALAMVSGLNGPANQGPSFDETVALWSPGNIKKQRAAMLRYMDRAVEIAKLPPEQRRSPLQQLEATASNQPVLVRLLVPAMSKVADALQRSHAQLRCAIAMVAAERYRLSKGRWPDGLDALKEAGLTATLIDVYDGQPLRLKRLEDGLVIYSIGPDGQDDGGKIDRRHPIAKGTDLGCRLWDVAKRRQPAKPLAPPEAQEQGAGVGK